MPNSLLLKEFDKIFHDLFEKNTEVYKKIVRSLADGQMTYEELSKATNYPSGGVFTEYLDNLVTSQFITRDYAWSFKNGKLSTLSKFRLSDNYIRFYLKFIEPNYEKIKRGYFEKVSVSTLPGWYTTLGYQFENLVIKNCNAIFKILRIHPEDIIMANPYFQTKTTTREGCQIDYLIQTKFNTLFVFEFKFSKNSVGMPVITDMQKKLKSLVTPKNFSTFPVLIHVNGVSEQVLDRGYFSKIINFSELLEQNID